MPNAVIYARISKDTAGEQLGVERQITLCHDLAKREGLTVVDVFVDNDLSAYARKPRPEFERLVEALRLRDTGAVLVYHVDRLYRRTTDLERLVDIVETSGTRVMSVAAGTVDLSTASGRMIARMLGAAAQHESERTSERLRVKNDELAAAGKRPGGPPPYGYLPGYEINPAEAEAIRFMADRVLDNTPLAWIARELDARGTPTRGGAPWKDSTVCKVLTKPAVAGMRIHRRRLAGKAEWEPILDRDTWETLRRILLRRGPNKPASQYLLSGLVENPSGNPMIGWGRYNNGTYERNYATKNRPGEPAPRPFITVKAPELEAFVSEAVLLTCDKTSIPAPWGDGTAAAEVARLEAEMAEVAEMYGRREISLNEWVATRRPMEQRLDEAMRQLGRPTKMGRLLSKKRAVRKAWESGQLTFVDKREIIATLVEKVVVLPAGRGRWTTLEERLDEERGGGIVWRV